jgi:hypothetical protein
MAAPSWLATQPPTPMMRSGLRVLQRLPAAELVKDLLLRFFADRAGVEEDDVGLRLVVRGHQAVALASRSSMRAESYSFIWQPWVLT